MSFIRLSETRTATLHSGNVSQVGLFLFFITFIWHTGDADHIQQSYYCPGHRDSVFCRRPTVFYKLYSIGVFRTSTI